MILELLAFGSRWDWLNLKINFWSALIGYGTRISCSGPEDNASHGIALTLTYHILRSGSAFAIPVREERLLGYSFHGEPALLPASMDP